MSGSSPGVLGVDTPSADRPGGPTSAANLLAGAERTGPVGMNTPTTPAEELKGGGVVDAQKILNFASTNNGTKVGNGECFDLVDKALRAAGAKSAADYGKVAADANYVWGSPVTLATVQPGDVIQFNNYVATTVIDTPKATDSTHADRPHHSAIVKSVDGNGVITVWEQNAPAGGEPVGSCALVFQDSSKKEGDEKTGFTTTTVTVTGTFKFYRPQPSK